MENFHIGGGLKPTSTGGSSFNIGDILDPLHIVDRTFNLGNNVVEQPANIARIGGDTVSNLGDDAKDLGKDLGNNVLESLKMPMIIGALGLILILVVKK